MKTRSSNKRKNTGLEVSVFYRHPKKKITTTNISTERLDIMKNDEAFSRIFG